MASEDQAMKGTENSSLFWVLVYMIAALAYLVALVGAWTTYREHQFNLMMAVKFCAELVALPIPLMMGRVFRKTLKNELGKGLLGERTFRMCDSWIPQLLLWSYICLVANQR